MRARSLADAPFGIVAARGTGLGEVARLLAILFGVGCLLPAPAAAEYSARTNFILHCQGCHGADGIGGTPGEVPPLAGAVGWFLRVPGGREYLAQVPGAANAPVSDAALAALLNYMLETYSRAEAGDAYRPYTEAEVASVRRARPDIVRARTSLVAAVQERFGVALWSEATYSEAEAHASKDAKTSLYAAPREHGPAGSRGDEP